MRAVLNDMRFVPALVVGGAVSFGLFLLMHHLIANNQQATNAHPQVTLVNFVQVQRNEQVQTKNYNVPKPPPPPKNPPPQQQVQTKQASNVQQQHLPVNVRFDVNSLGTGAGVNIGAAAPPTDAGGYAPLTPLMRITPGYPPDAEYQGVEGDIKVCFTVNPDGTVTNAYVKSATNPQARQMLAQAALRSVQQAKFFPQKVNGNPIAAPACYTVVFHIPKGQSGGGL